MTVVSRKSKEKHQVSDMNNLKCIVREVCNYFDISEHILKSKLTQRNISTPRQVAHYYTKELTVSLSWADIGRNIGNKDHTTVMHSYDVVRDRIRYDRKFKDKMIQLELILKAVIGLDYENIPQL